jgi:1-acyl-sn-glycerol-3-phosphate acyltransferase
LFFNKIHIEGISKVPKDKPIIFAVNHQNTLLDATLVAYLMRKNTYFLVRSDVFRGKVINWIFKKLYLIPISRGKDKRRNMAEFNRKTFEKCVQHLAARKPVLIFPEGESKANYQLASFKKGIARLAFQAEDEHDFNLEVHVIPVTINYQNHFKGNSDVWIKYCDPVLLGEYKNTFELSPAKAMNEFIKNLENTISENLVKFKDYNDAKPFFKQAVGQSIHSTTSLIDLFQSWTKSQGNGSGEQNPSVIKHVVSAISKAIFFPSIVLVYIMGKIIKDIDFKLSIISFSLLLFSILQIFTTSIAVVLYIGVKEGVITFISLIIVFFTLTKTYFTRP